jgi:hypothetical protein
MWYLVISAVEGGIMTGWKTWKEIRAYDEGAAYDDVEGLKVFLLYQRAAWWNGCVDNFSKSCFYSY